SAGRKCGRLRRKNDALSGILGAFAMSAQAAKVGFFRRRRVFIALLTLAVFVIAATAIYRYAIDQIRRLQPYIGKDLRLLSEDEQIEFDRLISTLVPEARLAEYPSRPTTWDSKKWWNYLTARPWLGWPRQPWYLWRV